MLLNFLGLFWLFFIPMFSLAGYFKAFNVIDKFNCFTFSIFSTYRIMKFSAKLHSSQECFGGNDAEPFTLQICTQLTLSVRHVLYVVHRLPRRLSAY